MRANGILEINDFASEAAFPVVDACGCACAIAYDKRDARVVGITAELLKQDIRSVTGVDSELRADSPSEGEPAIVIGTIGGNSHIDRLIEEGLLDAGAIRGKWEAFLITVVESNLIIAGADRRATAFGAFTLSRKMGVSPWYWWADVSPVKRESLYIKAECYSEGTPSIKYRGLFINDEVMGPGCLHDWARKTLEPEEGRIGPATYARLYELLLRLKANYLWPAMHPPSLWFYKNPANPQLAEDYAIVVGTSHCEQMMRNNMTEWDPETMGPWNYKTNKTRILDYWRERLIECRAFENTYTIGLRGTEDTELEGSGSMEEMVALTQQALDDQRKLITEEIDSNPSRVPQILCLYKEVLLVYQNGLEVPDDVTLLWVDDNHGYMRPMGREEERQRPGGSGVYYHLSLLGTPEGYLWLSSNSPMLMSCELTKAYEQGADRIWMFNVGGLKPAEKELNFGLDLAWDVSKWTPEKAQDYLESWACETFGKKEGSGIADILRRYYLLAASGKPEHVYRLEYSAEEIDQRLRDYQRLAGDAESIASQLPKEQQEAYFHLVLYQVQGARRMNERMLAGRRSLVLAAKGERTAALRDAKSSASAADELDRLDERYNGGKDGKWEHFMTWHPRFHRNEAPSILPQFLSECKSAVSARSLPLEEAVLTADVGFTEGTLRTKSKGGKIFLEWESEEEGRSRLWLRATKATYSETSYADENPVPRISGTINEESWDYEMHHTGNVWHTKMTAPIWYNVADVYVARGKNSLQVNLTDPLTEISGIRLSMAAPLRPENLRQLSAGDFSTKGNGLYSEAVVLPGLGTGKAVAAMPFAAPSLGNDRISLAPWVEYRLSVPAGPSLLQIRTLPNQQIHEGKGVSYAVTVDRDDPLVFNVQADEFSSEWQNNVIHGYTSRVIGLNPPEAGTWTIRIHLLDPGLVLRELVLIKGMEPV